MSMRQEQNEQNDFEQLRRLLALKRHEQPPPGYFDNFSRKVIARIEAGEYTRASAIERLLGEAPWMRRIWAAFRSQPVLSGVFGAAVSALVVFGVIFADKADISPVSLASDSSVATANTKPARFDNPLVAASPAPEFLSTTGAAMTNQARNAPLFGEIKLPVQTISFSLPSGQ